MEAEASTRRSRRKARLPLAVPTARTLGSCGDRAASVAGEGAEDRRRQEIQRAQTILRLLEREVVKIERDAVEHADKPQVLGDDEAGGRAVAEVLCRVAVLRVELDEGRALSHLFEARDKQRREDFEVGFGPARRSLRTRRFSFHDYRASTARSTRIHNVRLEKVAPESPRPRASVASESKRATMVREHIREQALSRDDYEETDKPL